MHILEIVWVVITVAMGIVCVAACILSKDIAKMQALGIATMLKSKNWFAMCGALMFCLLYFIALWMAHLQLAFWSGIMLTVISYGCMFYNYLSNKEIVEIYKAQLG